MDLEVEEQILFKSSAKTFVRTYNFLAAILPYGSVEWEMLSIFLALLIPKLPSPRGDDMSDGILETVVLATFHDLFGNIEWTDEDKVRRQIAELPDIVNRDEAYQNAKKNSDAQNARDESDRATTEAIMRTMSAGIELYKHISSNPSLKKWILDMVFNTTYDAPLPTDGEQSK